MGGPALCMRTSGDAPGPMNLLYSLYSTDVDVLSTCGENVNISPLLQGDYPSSVGLNQVSSSSFFLTWFEGPRTETKFIRQMVDFLKNFKEEVRIKAS